MKTKNLTSIILGLYGTFDKLVAKQLCSEISQEILMFSVLNNSDNEKYKNTLIMKEK